jgi:hypothetical protein
MPTDRMMTIICYNPITMEYALEQVLFTGDMEQAVNDALDRLEKEEREKIHVVCAVDGFIATSKEWPPYVESKVY